MDENNKLLLIDGHSIINRAFYGMPDLTNSKGVHTGAVYGFLSILFKLLEEEKPAFLLVAFDTHAPTFRHAMFPEYKGTRKAMPEELREQVPLLKKVLSAMQIAMYSEAGLEADDILGTCARRGREAGYVVRLVSGDRDLLQIADDEICVRIPKTVKGQTTIENYYADDVKERYQVTPRQFIELKALMGDSSDNIPGVPKVGEKTATQLIVDYGSVDGVYAHLGEITRKSLRETLAEHEDLARLSLELATIKTDCAIPLDWEKLRTGKLYTREAFELFTELNFRNFLGRFGKEEAAPADAREIRIRKIAGVSEAEDAFAVIKAVLKRGTDKEPGVVGIAAAAGPDGRLAMASVSTERTTYVFMACGDEDSEGKRTDEAYLARKIAQLREIARDRAGEPADGEQLSFFGGEKEEDTGPAVIAGFDFKNSFRYFGIDPEAEFSDGIRLEGMLDLLIGCYLCNPLKNDYTPEDMASEYLGIAPAAYVTLFGKTPAAEAVISEPDKFAGYLAQTADLCRRAAGEVAGRLIREGMWKLYTSIELPLSYILYDMQRLGIRIRPEALSEYSRDLGERADVLEKRIYEEAGETFNISSPKQLGEVLFEHMGLPGGKKTKTGYSTAADVLEKLAPDYSIIRDILDYRAVAKLKSTYADGLAAYVSGDGRIHTTFNQTITATGRISSADPNLQNIPMRTEMGRQIRKAFIPGDGCIFTDADYSQIELRILAVMSGDEELIRAYRQNSDIHRITASKVFHTPFEEVTDLQRRNAKAVNFGIVYGISSFGLSQDLSISRKEAAEYIESYFATYPQVKAFLDRQVADAKEKGYVTTLYGRRRPIPELKSGNFMTRQFGERVAMNSPIQGTAADIMKIAMIRVWERIAREKLRSKLILQIHDELLIETAQGEEDEVRRVLAEEMQNAAVMPVELITDIHSGSDWYEAK